MAAMADDLGAEIMENIKLGYVHGRTPEVSFVPKPHSFIAGNWDLTTLGSDTPFLATAHPAPWNYIARVPIIFYGRPYVPSGKTVYDHVDIAGIARTYADLLGVDRFDAEGKPLDVFTRTKTKDPKVIFSIVIDGGGWNALQEHPDSWPVIRSLSRHGTTFVNADIGSAPSITGAVHATFGTGDYPAVHGLPGNQMRAPDGENVDTWLQQADGRYLREPTVSEAWDEQNDNKPVVGTVSYEGWHLGMIGRGSLSPGGDKDVAALWEVGVAEEGEEAVPEGWWVNEDYYTLPRSVRTTDFETLERYEEGLDPRDGIRDGTWFGQTVEELQESTTRPGTPAFARFTGDTVVDTMREFEVGRDGVTDMFWVEMKMPDFAGHIWNMTEPEEADVLREVDTQVGRFVRELDRSAGRGRYVLMISADHGQQPLPDLNGGWRINTTEFENDLEAEFGDVVEKVTPIDIYLDLDAIDSGKVDTEEMARWIGTYTIGDNIPAARPGAELVPRGLRDETIFAAAFSADYLNGLTDEDIQGFGDSEYEEGDLTVSRAGEEE